MHLTWDFQVDILKNVGVDPESNLSHLSYISYLTKNQYLENLATYEIVSDKNNEGTTKIFSSKQHQKSSPKSKVDTKSSKNQSNLAAVVVGIPSFFLFGFLFAAWFG